MVCIPCFIIPVLLYIWHKFFQPIFLRYWNPWEEKDADGNVIKATPEFPFQCKNGVCSFMSNKKPADNKNDNETKAEKTNNQRKYPKAEMTVMKKKHN